MLEMGSFAKSEHLNILEQLEKITAANHVFCVGETFYQFKNNFEFQFFMNSEALATFFETHPISNTFVLLKASRGVRLEKIIPFLQ